MVQSLSVFEAIEYRLIFIRRPPCQIRLPRLKIVLPTTLRVDILKTVCLATAARPPWFHGLLGGTRDICPPFDPENSASILLKAVVLGRSAVVVAHVPDVLSGNVAFLTGV